MKTLKTTALIGIMLLIASVSFAQQRNWNNAPGERMGTISDETLTTFGLSEKQVASFREIQKTHFENMRTLRLEFGEGDLTPNAFREKRNKLQKAHQMQVRELLNDSQYAALAEYRQNQRREAVNRSGNRQGNYGMQRGQRPNRDGNRPNRQ